MTLLKSLQSVGYTAEFFKLPEAGYAYYTFDGLVDIHQASYWNIVGIKQQKGKDFCVDLQILYIGEEDFEYEHFSPLQNASNLLSISLDEMQAFIRLLEGYFPLENISPEDKLVHFSLMGEQELANLHYTKRDIQHFFGHYYVYLPSPHLQTIEKMSVIRLPSWIFEGKVSSTNSLFFATFEYTQLNDPAFRLRDGVWRGSMQFDLPALSEFVFLLKQQVIETIRFMQQDFK